MIYTAREIADIVGGVIAEGSDESAKATFAFFDSREYEGGAGLFVAIKGVRNDGHDFVKAMLDKGNIALIENAAYLQPNTVLVESTETALEALSEHYRLHTLKKTEVVAVTGSVGKTGTKDMTALAISAGKKVFKTPGNRNNNIGLPLTLLSVPPDTEVAVIECGISEPDEMCRLSKCCRPDIAIITNIGYSHIGAFGSREAIRDEKLQIISWMRDGGSIIFNGDEPLLYGVIDKNHRRLCCALENTGCCCRAESICENESGITFDLILGCERIPVTLNVKGKHNVGNALYAVAAAYILGVDVNAAASALAEFRPFGSRQNIYEYDGKTFIADYYNASPESMRSAIALLADAKGRKIAVLGDMLELGSFSDELHEQIGEECHAAGCDVLITIGPLARLIAKAAKLESYSFDTDCFAEAANKLSEIMREGDTVLFKASNRMNLGEIIRIIKGE